MKDTGNSTMMRRREHPSRLRRQLVRGLTFAMLLPALLIAGLFAAYEYYMLDRQQGDRLRLAVRLTAVSIDQFVETHASAVALMAQEPETHRTAADLEKLRSLFPSFVTALATDASGRITAAAPLSVSAGATRRSVADRDYFRVPAQEGRRYVSDAFVGRGLGSDSLVAVSAPIIADGRFEGVVEGSIKVDTFTALRSSALRARGQEMLVVDRAGRVIYASAGLPLRFLQPVRAEGIFEGEESVDGVSPAVVSRSVISGLGAWTAWSELHSGWRVALLEPRGPALAGVAVRTLLSMALLGIALLLTIVLAHRRIRMLELAIGYTLRNLRAIASGERSPAIPLDNVQEELRPVAEEVIQLASKLQDANSELRSALDGQVALAAELGLAKEQLEQTVRERTSELEAANRHLAQLSRTDPLTGLLNVRGLTGTYAQLTDSQGCLNQQTSVVAIDVDYFKRFNDIFGHPAGDQVLRRVAAGISASLRSAADRVARVGGEEFLLLLPGSDPATARQVAERVREEIHAMAIPHAEGVNGVVTVSLGVSTGLAGEPVDAVVQLADAALYRAKQAGRDCVMG